MAKLDDQIAQVAVALGTMPREEAEQTAKRIAKLFSRKEIEKLPERWSASVSAKKAGTPDLKDNWDLLWFEAITELLFQLQLEGLAGLTMLLERESETYHQYVVRELLRLAAEDIERDQIMLLLHQRFQTLQYVKTRECVREVTYWQKIHSKPLELLHHFKEIECPCSDGDTIALYLEQIAQEYQFHQARTDA
ncbi:MAG: hypothetical protein R3B84_22705 [Zavarzinella sp.]